MDSITTLAFIVLTIKLLTPAMIGIGMAWVSWRDSPLCVALGGILIGLNIGAIVTLVQLNPL